MRLFFVVFTLLCAQIAFGANFCTPAMVQGNYAFLADGSILVPNTPITGPFMRIGWFQADGQGNLSIRTLAIYNGINFGPEVFSGTYQVSNDCTFDATLAVPAPIFANVEFKGQVADGGNDLTFMLVNSASPQAPPITTVVGFGKRRNRNTCSAEDIQGSWRIELNGTRNLPPFGTGTAFRQVGRIVADGTGGLTATFITSNNGVISQDLAAGGYNISADCTFDLYYPINLAPYSIHGSIIDDKQAYAALNMPGQNVPNVGSVNGTVVTGLMVRESQ